MMGAIYNNHSNIDIFNSEFKECHADRYAGVIYNRGHLNIFDSKFVGCYANNYAGVIYNQQNTFNCYNSSFINNNVGVLGGVVFN